MIKTLKITGFLAVLATVACVAMLAMLALKGDPSIRKFLDSESAVTIFKKKTTKTSSATGQVSPLVKQAKALALRINPPPKPKPVAKKPTKRTAPGQKRAIPTPKAAKINTKFNLVATCKYEDQPEKSMALLDLPAKGLEWFRQGQEINHLVIHQINDGNIVLYKGGVENSIATMPVEIKKSLLKSDNAVISEPDKPTRTPRTNAIPDDKPLQLPEGSAFPKDIFEKLMGRTQQDQDQEAETPVDPKQNPRNRRSPTQNTVRKKRPTPPPVSEEEKQKTAEDTISNIKRIMSEDNGQEQQETNEMFKKLLETLQAEEEQPAKPAE